MRNLHGLNQYRSEKFNEILLRTSQARAEAEKLKLDAATVQTAIDQESNLSSDDALEATLLSELRRENAISDRSNPEATLSTEVPLYATSSQSLVDYSIAPPANEAKLPNVKIENDEPVSDSNLVNVKPDDLPSHSASALPDTNNVNEPIQNDAAISELAVDANAGAALVTDEEMILPAVGSDQTLVHKNDTLMGSSDSIEKIDSSEVTKPSMDGTNVTPDCIAEIDAKIDNHVTAPVEQTESGASTSDSNNVKDDNIADPESDKPVGDLETLVKVQ
jgi:hypothetical protein